MFCFISCSGPYFLPVRDPQPLALITFSRPSALFVFSQLPVQLLFDHPKYFSKIAYFLNFARYSGSVNFRDIVRDVSNWGCKKLIRGHGKVTGDCPKEIEPKNQGGEKL